MGTTPASPEEPSDATPPAEAIATNIPCGNCPGGILLIRDDGYVYCPVCDHEHPPYRAHAAHATAGASAGSAAHRSRYPERIEGSDLFVPKAELAATASDEDHAVNDADYAAYQQRYSDAVQPVKPLRPRHATAATRKHGARHAS